MRFILLSIAIISIASSSYLPKKDGSVPVVVSNVAKEKELSFQFQMLRSSNRVQLFLGLQPYIKTKENKQLVLSSTKDVIALLGKPDIKIKESQFVYTLNSSAGCSAIIEFDNKGFANFCTIRGCN